MERKINELYDEYKIMPNLREHMFRVAAVASLICDNFEGEINKKDIVSACLLHDMGNIVKFKLDLHPHLNEPKGMEYWQQVQEEFRNKYSNDDHLANCLIAKEIGVNKRVVELIESISFLGAQENALNPDFGKKVVDYADNRAAPFGIASIDERFADLRKRYAHHKNNTTERDVFESSIRKIEEQIFQKCKIKPEDINDTTVAPIISELRNFVIG